MVSHVPAKTLSFAQVFAPEQKEFSASLLRARDQGQGLIPLAASNAESRVALGIAAMLESYQAEHILVIASSRHCPVVSYIAQRLFQLNQGHGIRQTENNRLRVCFERHEKHQTCWGCNEVTLVTPAEIRSTQTQLPTTLFILPGTIYAQSLHKSGVLPLLLAQHVVVVYTVDHWGEFLSVS